MFTLCRLQSQILESVISTSATAVLFVAFFLVGKRGKRC